ncbi:MAG: dienelactone hydrolase family protein [Ginsengibacter sp.]
MVINKVHPKKIVTAGKNIKDAKKVFIMIHGRGGSAEDILSLATHFPGNDFALLAPQANNNSWYPYSFMAPPSNNEPWLSAALSTLKEILDDVIAEGISKENIYFLGFSQGACLTLEFVTRNASKFGGSIAFTGGLIGDKIYSENYKGDFKNTPIFIGSSNPDPHVPLQRVQATTNILRAMNAEVTEKIYENMGHTITQDEIRWAHKSVFHV